MIDSESISRLEQLSSDAWVAQEKIKMGGWLLRANHGVTRRANSVLTISPPQVDNTEDAISQAIQFYKSRGLPPLFQLSEVSYPKNLDETLAKSGFAVGLQVYLQTASVGRVLEQSPSIDIQIESTPSKEWMNTYATGSRHNVDSMEIRKELMLRSPLEKGFGAVLIDDEIEGVGLCIVDGAWAGLFNITTLSRYRRQGVATSVNQGLTRWASTREVKKMYLQVEIENQQALSMYNRLGFETSYRYWYRRLP
ncbi:MAG: GNAT family N-acetyltransferase [Candidatus Thorarchaeota archaeon]